MASSEKDRERSLPAACGGENTATDYEVLGPEAESLRAAFEADSGKVRALFLASPA